MNWKSIRLELARTEQFPQGSAGRSYLLRLPLSEDGLVDESSINESPAHAIVRRFWPNEPDRIGTVVPTSNGLAFCYESSEDEEGLLHLEPHPIRLGGFITLPEPDGTRLPFRVTSMRQVR
jgi:hypothetical protein